MTTNDRRSTRDDSTEPTEHTADRLADRVDADRTTLSPSVLFGILADTRPRYALYYLTTHDGTSGIDDLVNAIATRENDTTIELLTSEMKRRVRTNLYHAELPKLADYGFVEYDLEDETVTPTPRTEELTPYLKLARRLEGDERP